MSNKAKLQWESDSDFSILPIDAVWESDSTILLKLHEYPDEDSYYKRKGRSTYSQLIWYIYVRTVSCSGALRIFLEMPTPMKIKICEYARCEARIKEEIIASAKDSRIFFDAITKPRRPSDTLKKALDDYVVFNNNLRVKLIK